MEDPVAGSLSVSDEELERAFEEIRQNLSARFGDAIGIEGMLFLIGVQERGIGFHPKLRKERKQDLIMHGTHCVMETLGIYKRREVARGEMTWERSVDLPELTVEEQEKLLRVAIVRYFSGRPDRAAGAAK